MGKQEQEAEGKRRKTPVGLKGTVFVSFMFLRGFKLCTGYELNKYIHLIHEVSSERKTRAREKAFLSAMCVPANVESAAH